MQSLIYVYIYLQQCVRKQKQKRKKYCANNTKYTYRYIHTARQDFRSTYFICQSHRSGSYRSPTFLKVMQHQIQSSQCVFTRIMARTSTSLYLFADNKKKKTNDFFHLPANACTVIDRHSKV